MNTAKREEYDILIGDWTPPQPKGPGGMPPPPGAPKPTDSGVKKWPPEDPSDEEDDEAGDGGASGDGGEEEDSVLLIGDIIKIKETGGYAIVTDIDYDLNEVEWEDITDLQARQIKDGILTPEEILKTK